MLGRGGTLKNQGTPTGSEAIAMANGKASIEIIPDGKNNLIRIMVLNQSFKGSYLTISN
jgi:beta-galactosidase